VLATILLYCSFKELNVIMMTRPALSNYVSWTDVLLSVPQEERIWLWSLWYDDVERYKTTLHVPSAHRLCRILTRARAREWAVCETCGRTESNQVQGFLPW
jgi:hypothetical protein